MTDEAKKANHFGPGKLPGTDGVFAGVFAPGFRRGVWLGSAGVLFALVSDANGDQIRNVKEEWQALAAGFFQGGLCLTCQSRAGANWERRGSRNPNRRCRQWMKFYGRPRRDTL